MRCVNKEQVQWQLSVFFLRHTSSNRGMSWRTLGNRNFSIFRMQQRIWKGLLGQQAKGCVQQWDEINAEDVSCIIIIILVSQAFVLLNFFCYVNLNINVSFFWMRNGNTPSSAYVYSYFSNLKWCNGKACNMHSGVHCLHLGQADDFPGFITTFRSILKQFFWNKELSSLFRSIPIHAWSSSRFISNLYELYSS